MVKRCIGIDVGSSYLCAVQVSRVGEQFHIEKIFSTQTRRSTDLPQDVLKTLINRHGFDRRADVAVSMPYDAVFFRNLETDSAGTEQVCERDRSALEHNFPIQPDEIVIQVCSCRPLPGEKYSVLTAAVTRESLRERLGISMAAKVRPNLVEAAIFAIRSTVEVNHPEIMTGTAMIAYVDESYLILAITQNNNILIVRNIPIVSCSDNNIDSVQRQVVEVLSREVEITWRKVFGAEIEQDSKIYLVAGNGVSSGLESAVEENLRCQITIVNPYAKVKRPPEYNDDAPICIAEGLALRLLAPEETTGINFLEADGANIKPTLDLKKEFIICAALLAAIAIVSLTGLFMRLSHLETKYAQVKNEIREIFQRTLPEEINIVNPIVQLEQKLQSLRKDYALFGAVSGTGVEPLEVLHAITTSVPREVNININDMLIASESVRLTGTSQSFESVYNWQRLLQKAPQFSTVDIQNIRREPESELVHFTVLVSLTVLEQVPVLHYSAGDPAKWGPE